MQVQPRQRRMKWHDRTPSPVSVVNWMFRRVPALWPVKSTIRSIMHQRAFCHPKIANFSTPANLRFLNRNFPMLLLRCWKGSFFSTPKTAIVGINLPMNFIGDGLRKKSEMQYSYFAYCPKDFCICFSKIWPLRFKYSRTMKVTFSLQIDNIRRQIWRIDLKPTVWYYLLQFRTHDSFLAPFYALTIWIWTCVSLHVPRN